MDSFIQILCRFQKSNQKVPLNHSLPPKDEKKSSFGGGGVMGDFSFLRSNGGGTFRLHFWNLRKIWIKESIDLNSVQFGRRCNIG